MRLKNYFKIIGIEQNQKYLFTVKSVLAICFIFYGSVGTFEIVLFENVSFIDLGTCYYAGTCLIVNVFTLSGSVMQRKKIFGFLEKIRKLVDTSEI